MSTEHQGWRPTSPPDSTDRPGDADGSWAGSEDAWASSEDQVATSPDTWTDPGAPAWSDSGDADEPSNRTRSGPSVARARQVAELWRAAGLGLSMVWSVVLGLVVYLWVSVTFRPAPGQELPGNLELVLAPVAVVGAGLLLWTLVSAWRIIRRRASGWDAIVVLGSFAIAVAVLVWAPGRFVSGLDAAPRSLVITLGAFGLASVVAGMLAERAFRRAATGLEPSEDDLLPEYGESATS